MTNGNFDFNNVILRGNYARELRSYFDKYSISPSEWWASPNPTKAEILFHHRNGKLENEREISRVSVIVEENNPSKLSFGLSGYNYRIGEYARNDCATRGYSYKVHMQRPKKTDNILDQKKSIPGRWWVTKSFDSLEEVVRELKELEPLLTERD